MALQTGKYTEDQYIAILLEEWTRVSWCHPWPVIPDKRALRDLKTLIYHAFKKQEKPQQKYILSSAGDFTSTPCLVSPGWGEHQLSIDNTYSPVRVELRPPKFYLVKVKLDLSQ